ncbi:hypothetical protein GGI43DRAFT_385685 [Trichoderma evansii]
MVSYQENQEIVWIHELLHIYWVSKATPYGTNDHVTDLKLDTKDSQPDNPEPEAYGAKMTKALARFKSRLIGTTGDYTIRNADSMAMYALVRYVQKALGGVYPHYPLAPEPPSDVTPRQRFIVDGYFTIDSNGTVEIPANRTLLDAVDYTLDMGVCLASDDEDGDSNADAFFTVNISQVIVETDYPADYLSSCQANCAGDYYVLEGHNLDSPSNQCLVIRNGNLPQTSTTGNSCEWFTNGGSTRANCSAGTLTQPLSWRVLGGVCTAHDTGDCSNDGNAHAYAPGDGCHNYSTSNNDLKTWVSLQCGALVDVSEPKMKPLQIVSSTIVVNGTGPSRTQQHTSVMTNAVDSNFHSPLRFQPRPTSRG